jgi:hypothetical protein
LPLGGFSEEAVGTFFIKRVEESLKFPLNDDFSYCRNLQ